jgi:NDP-sugar pyrophosphorylase family protein
VTIAAGAVIAAGQGSRLSGLGVPKPLVPVAGQPLIAHALGNLSAAGIRRAVVIFNGDEEDCASYVRERFPVLVSSVIVKTTASSLESFREVLAAAPPGRLLVTTVDAFMTRPDFLAFVAAAERLPEDVTVVAVTPFVADEKPLWVTTLGNGRVARIGGDSGDTVTAGLYLLSERARSLSPPENLPRLRDFLAWLCASGEPIAAISIAKVVDVDRPEDLEMARALAGAAPAPGEGAA